MAGGKESPRGKMIGMMYLVLTALLAMNVSKDILESFLVINEGMLATQGSFESKIQTTFDQFKFSAEDNPAKFGENFEKAKKVKAQADEVKAYITDLKKAVILLTDKKIDLAAVADIEAVNTAFESSAQSIVDEEESVSDLDSAKHKILTMEFVDSKDNYDVPTMLMLGSEPKVSPKPAEEQWSALQLKQKLNDFNAFILSQIDKEKSAKFHKEMQNAFDLEKMFKTADNAPPETWEMAQFYHLPLAAVITNLSKLQMDVQNVEADVLKELMGEVTKSDFKADMVAAKVIANSNYIIAGDSFSADIFVAAYSTTQDPEVELYYYDDKGNEKGKIEDAKVQRIPGTGKAVFTFKASQKGDFYWGGKLKVKDGEGQYQEYPINLQKYTVAEKALVVSPTKMNVVYRKLQNPMEVSAPGYASQNLAVSCPGHTIVPVNKSKGEYMLTPGAASEAKVTVVATDDEGNRINLGFKEFRVKNVPPPTPYFAGITGSGTVAASKVRAAMGVSARMDNFDFDLSYTVVSFSMSMMYKGNLVEKKSNDNKVTDGMSTLLSAANKGSKIYIEDIKAKGPAGVMSLGSISIKVQ